MVRAGCSSLKWKYAKICFNMIGDSDIIKLSILLYYAGKYAQGDGSGNFLISVSKTVNKSM